MSDESPWQSDREEFTEATVVKLRCIGKECGKRADAGDESAKLVIELYRMLYKSFDPLTHIRLKTAIEEYEAGLRSETVAAKCAPARSDS